MYIIFIIILIIYFLGIYEECLFDKVYSNNIQKANIINAYELVSEPGINCRTIMDVDAVDVATVFVMWLYYLPKPLISPKLYSMICGTYFFKLFYE